jgi:hypothetical protein
MREHIYLGDGDEVDLDALDQGLEFYDASSLRHMADCPRKFYYAIIRGINHPSRFLFAGRGIHAGVDVWSLTKDRERALTVLEEEWGDTDMFPCPEWEQHLTLGNLEVVLKNYFDYDEMGAGGQYQPLTFKLDDLDLSSVIGAKLRLLDDDTVVLGESSILMTLEVDGNKFPYAGKPDMIVSNPSGNFYIMDHKTTSSYISDWNLNQHRVSNQLRCYAAMLGQLTGQVVHGGIINAIYVGKRAADPNFGGTPFSRRRFVWDSDHLKEALRNQYRWIKQVQEYAEEDYYPQTGNTMCRSCSFGKLCDTEPSLRDGVLYTDYEEGTRVPFFQL